MRQFSQPLLDCQSSSWVYTASLAPPGDSAKEYPSFRPPSSGGLWKVPMRSAFLFLLACAAFPRPAVAQTDEIVANLAGGRVIVTVARDAIVFGVINHAVESTSVPPRAAQVDPSHIGIFFGASEWQVPAEPRPIRLDHDLQYVRPNNQAYRPPGTAESDLEQIGIGLLEKLRPLVSQLHRKIDLKPDEPLFSLVLIGYAQNYGPEVWVIDYRAEQEPFGSKISGRLTFCARASRNSTRRRSTSPRRSSKCAFPPTFPTCRCSASFSRMIRRSLTCAPRIRASANYSTKFNTGRRKKLFLRTPPIFCARPCRSSRATPISSRA